MNTTDVEPNGADRATLSVRRSKSEWGCSNDNSPGSSAIRRSLSASDPGRSSVTRVLDWPNHSPASCRSARPNSARQIRPTAVIRGRARLRRATDDGEQNRAARPVAGRRETLAASSPAVVAAQLGDLPVARSVRAAAPRDTLALVGRVHVRPRCAAWYLLQIGRIAAAVLTSEVVVPLSISTSAPNRPRRRTAHRTAAFAQ